MGGGSFENMVGKNIFKEEKTGRRKRVLGKGYVVLFIVVMPLIHILNKTSNKSKYSRRMEKGVRNIIFGFGNGKIVMKTAVLPFLFCIKKENCTLS